MSEPKFVGESIEVVAESLEQGAVGEPALPRRFIWRGDEIEIACVAEQWKETRADTHGSGQQYVYKHWYRIETGDGRVMKLYFERRPRSKAQAKKRWWLFSVTEAAEPGRT